MSDDIEYRYEFEDTLSGEKKDVLPCYGVHLNSYLVTRGRDTQYGDCTATVRSDVKGRTVDDILGATEPGRTNLWVYQNEEPVWGGIIWNRTYSSQAGGTYQLYAQTFDSYADCAVFDTDESYTDDARNIIRSVWQYVQGSPPFNIRLQLAAATSVAQSITKVLVGEEQVYASDLIKQMIGLGAEYRLTYSKTSAGRPQARVEYGRWDGLAAPLGIAAGDGSPVITYPGNISNYWWSESGSKGGTDFHGIGKGTGATTPRGFIRDEDAIASGRPAVAKKLNFREAESQAIFDEQLERARDSLKLPVVTPTFKMQDTNRRGSGLPFITMPEALMGSFHEGDYLYTVINDPGRFPNGYKGYFRVVGRSFSPGSGEFDILLDQSITLSE